MPEGEAFSRRKQLIVVLAAIGLAVGLILMFGGNMIKKTMHVHDKQLDQRKQINEQYEGMGFDDYTSKGEGTEKSAEDKKKELEEIESFGIDLK